MSHFISLAGVEPDVISYKNLMRAYVHDIRAVEKCFSRMIERKLQPDLSVSFKHSSWHVHLLETKTKDKQPEPALELFDAMKR